MVNLSKTRKPSIYIPGWLQAYAFILTNPLRRNLLIDLLRPLLSLIFLITAGSSIKLALDHQGEIVGLIIWKKPLVQYLCISEKFRGLGLGRLLVKKSGCTEARIVRSSKGFWGKMGFQKVKGSFNLWGRI